MKILVINGPNLNLLGKREKAIYGERSYEDLKKLIYDYCSKHDVEVEIFQSNFEGEIIEKIHMSKGVDGIVINAGAYTHTSVAIRDALSGVDIPFIEVHISNVYKREPFRHKSMLSDIATGVISGLKFHSYLYAIDFFINSR